MIRESDIEENFVRYIHQLGGKSYKLKRHGQRGWPDQTVFLPNRFGPLFIELKRPKTGRPSQQQISQLIELNKFGHPGLITDSFDEAVTFVLEYVARNMDGP